MSRQNLRAQTYVVQVRRVVRPTGGSGVSATATAEWTHLLLRRFGRRLRRRFAFRHPCNGESQLRHAPEGPSARRRRTPPPRRRPLIGSAQSHARLTEIPSFVNAISRLKLATSDTVRIGLLMAASPSVSCRVASTGERWCGADEGNGYESNSRIRTFFQDRHAERPSQEAEAAQGDRLCQKHPTSASNSCGR
jgi:hypothetical protein